MKLRDLFYSLSVLATLLVMHNVYAKDFAKPKFEVKRKAIPAKSHQQIIKAPKTKEITLRRGSTFKEWKDNKVPSKKSYKTLLSIVSEPKAKNVKNVIFIAAGQQQPDPRNLAQTAFGYPNVLTGQSRFHRAACQDLPTCQSSITTNSLADRIIKSNKFPLNSTLFILVFDTQFNHLVREGNKIKIENAFWDLLTTRFYSGNVKQIALIGQSKGGCLAYSLGKRFRTTTPYKNIPLIIQGFDPVCKKNRLTHGETAQYFSNPLVNKPKYKSRYVNMNAVFPANSRKNLALLNIHSGAPVLLDGVHSFTFKPNDVDLGWWKQAWVPYGHTPMGGNMDYSKDTVIPGFKHLMKYVNKFSGYAPPGGGTLGGSIAACPKLFPKKVGVKGNKPICVAHVPNKIKAKKCTNRSSPGQVWSAKYCIWQKKDYWHARPIKAKDKTQKCPLKLGRKVDTLNGKPVCMSVAPRKIKRKKCSTIHGSNCVWNEGHYYKARPLK